MAELLQTQQQQPQNVFPSTVLFNSLKAHVSVELRTGVCLVGTLTKCDAWMNLVLQNVLRFSADGTQSWKTPETCVRGNAIRTVRVADAAVRQRDALMSGQRRERDGAGAGAGAGGDQPPQRKMSADARNKKYAKPKK